MDFQKESEQQKTFQQKEKSRKYFWIFLWLTLAIVVTSIIFLWQYLQRPSVGVINIQKTTESQESGQVTYERLEGKHVSFHYDQAYAVKNHEQEPRQGGVILESAFLSQGETSSKKIALTVENLQNRKMEDSGNFILREKNPKLYLKEKNDLGVTFETTKDGYLEKVYFIPKNTYLVQIAFSGPIDMNGEFKAEISDIIKSVQFK